MALASQKTYIKPNRRFLRAASQPPRFETKKNQKPRAGRAASTFYKLA